MAVPGINISCSAEAGVRPDIRIARPVHASKVLHGQTPDQVLESIQRLYRVCGIAQTALAMNVLETARGGSIDHDEAVVHGVLVRFEMAREQLWRMLFDWARLCGVAAARDAIRFMQNLVPEATICAYSESPFITRSPPRIKRAEIENLLRRLDRVLEMHIFGATPEFFLSLSGVAALERFAEQRRGIVPSMLLLLARRGWQSSAATNGSFLPSLPADALDGRLMNGVADRFVERPDWLGSACETSPFERQRNSELVWAVISAYGHGLYARVVAAARELAETSTVIRECLDGGVVDGLSCEAMGDGKAIAHIEAARGRLVHRVEIDDADRVTDYRTVAPTEWNFHPHGVVADGLMNAAEEGYDGFEQRANLLVTLLDPCVGYSLEVQ
ncbi:MAG: hypothetical protein AAF578_07680 [Pseudomonadota bacterium]